MNKNFITNVKFCERENYAPEFYQTDTKFNYYKPNLD